MTKKSFAKYDTRATINKGAVLRLANPETGEDEGDWLRLRYSLADDYAAAREEAERCDAIAGADQYGSVERNSRMLVPLVADWSFDEPATPDHVFEFLCLAPHVHGEIIREATLEGKLFATPAKPSASGRAQNSPSTESPAEHGTE